MVESIDEKKVDKEITDREYTTRDIYLAAFCVLEGLVPKLYGVPGSSQVSFRLEGPRDKVLDLVKGYFDGTARCSPKALKFAITDLKNQMYSVTDSKGI